MDVIPFSPPADVKVPLQQHPDYLRALVRYGCDAQHVAVVRGNSIICHALLQTRRIAHCLRLNLISRGPIWAPNTSPEDECQAVEALGHKFGITVFNSERPPKAQGNGLVRLITPSHIVELDLNKHPEDLRSEMAGKWRNRLVGAENAKLSLQSIKMPTDANHWLWARDAEHQRLKSFRALPHDLTRAYLHVSPNAGRLFTVLENGIPRAAMLFLRHGSTASYHIGWNSDRGRALNAHNLLLWRAMIALRDQGIERLDLGSIDTEASPGLARFKLGSGAKPRPLGGSWLYSRATAALSRRSPNLIHPELGLLN